MTRNPGASSNRRQLRIRLRLVFSAIAALTFQLVGCAHVGKMTTVSQTVAPADTTGGHHPERALRTTPKAHQNVMFGPDTLIGFQPGTGDSTRRYLGRLLDGYTADTLNLILMGDNRPGYRSTRLNNDLVIIRQGVSANPVRIGKALIHVPIALFKGLYPDLALPRDVPELVRAMPTAGRENQVLHAIMAKVDTLNTQKRTVAAAINTGDLVYDGRRPAHWQRFLNIWQPLYSRVPYFAVAGYHEKTWTEEGLANWRAATGLPIAGDRMYYCFDSADGWVRFVALDSNPLTNRAQWSEEVSVKYSKEEIDWLKARLKEHRGPAFVFLHSPPFSAGGHRMEWEMDPVMKQRREALVAALHEGGISVLASGHEHTYQRALMTFPDGVLISIVQGGGGAPLHPLPSQAQSAQLYAAYGNVAGGVIKPENVYAASINNFCFLRLWFEGGELQTYAVNKDGSSKLVDLVKIDLKRYGHPKIDQHKVPIAPTAPVAISKMQAEQQHGITPKTKTTAPSNRIESHPPPGKRTKSRTVPARATSTHRTIKPPVTHSHSG
jgi:hypothetical protein